jgi:hypothetical protein
MMTMDHGMPVVVWLWADPRRIARVKGQAMSLEQAAEYAVRVDAVDFLL